jgi:hypothetical protein
LIDQLIVEVEVHLACNAPRGPHTLLDFFEFGNIRVLALLGVYLNNFNIDVHLEIINIVVWVNICLLDDLSVLVELNLRFAGLSPIG